MTSNRSQVQRVSQSARHSHFWKMIGWILPLFLTGCANGEHRYAIQDLPTELIANRHQMPFAADLSNSIVRTHLVDIEPGDTVEISLLSGASADRISRVTTIVAPDGTVMLPVLGRVELSGVPLQSATESVTRAGAVSSEMTNPNVQITLKEPRQNRITVLGAVARPGVYSLPRNESDLVAALAMAGGMSRSAGAKISIQGSTTMNRSHTTMRVNDSPVVEVGAPDITTSLSNSASPSRREIDLSGAPAAIQPTELADGDVVVVEQGEVPSVMVTGTVGKPGRYDFPVGREFTVLDAIGMAQGIPNKVVDTVVVCRRVANQDEKALIQVSLHEAVRNPSDDLLLMPGDIVSVEPTPKSLFKDTMKYVRTAVGGAAVVFIKR